MFIQEECIRSLSTDEQDKIMKNLQDYNKRFSSENQIIKILIGNGEL